MSGTDPAGSAKQIALTAYRQGAANAGELLSAALKDEPHDGELLIAEASVRASRGDMLPLDRLEAVLARAPEWVSGHRALAQLKAMLGDPAPFSAIESALEMRPDDPKLALAFLALLGGAGRYEDAAQKASELRRRIGDIPGLKLIEARFAGFAGRCEDAADLLRDLPADLPELEYEKARNSLRLGEFGDASAAIDRALALGKADIGVWALAELCWRIESDPRHQWLYSETIAAEQFDLGLSAEELSETVQLLRGLHDMNAAPLGQSVEGGTQTLNDLRHRSDPCLLALFERIHAVLAKYTGEMASLPTDHPLAALGHRSAEITASWSIRLSAGGRHFPHMHDSGLISSAVHLAVPDALGKGEGELELGRPPEDIPIDLAPVASFAPKRGHLILFPSFLYHGTSRFGEGERLTVAFDAA